MECPLLIIAGEIPKKSEQIYTGKCIEAECAWWDKVYGCCGELSKVKALRTLIDTNRILAKELTLIRPPGK